MKDSRGKLSRKHEQAIAALLNERTIVKAAERVGVGEVTLWRWLQQNDFKAEYRKARREVVGVAVGRLQQASCEAVQTLCDVMADSNAPASSRVSAARNVLELAMKAVELEDLEERISVLERTAQNRVVE